MSPSLLIPKNQSCPNLAWIFFLAVMLPVHGFDLQEDFGDHREVTAWAQAGSWIVEGSEFVQLGSEFSEDSEGAGLGMVGADELAPRIAIYRTNLSLLGPVVQITWNVRIDQEGSFDLFARGPTEGSGQMETIGQVRLENGQVRAAINGGGGFATVGQIPSGAWTKVTARIDLETQHYQVVLDDHPPSQELHFATNSDEKIKSLTWVGFAKSHEGAGRASFDNLTVESPLQEGAAPVSQILMNETPLTFSEDSWETIQTGGAAQRKMTDGLGTISTDQGAGELSGKASLVAQADGWRFLLPGQPPEKRLGKWQGTVPEDVQQLGQAQYVSIKYSANGFFREIGDAYPVIQLTGKDAKGRKIEEVIIDSTQVVNDERSHVMVARFKSPIVPESVQVQLVTSDSKAFFTLAGMTLHGEAPALEGGAVLAGSLPAAPAQADFLPVDLKNFFNDSVGAIYRRVLEKQGKLLDGSSHFATPTVVSGGIPFQIGHLPSGFNVAASAQGPSGNEERVPFYNGEVARFAYGPNGRDDSLEIPIGRAASEIFLCLSSENVPSQKRAVSGGVPFQFDDVEAFVVEIVYEDGETDLAFPFSLADGAPVIRRMIGTYAIAADPARTIKSLILRNRVFNNTVGLVALTLNLSSQRLLPALAGESPVVRPPRRDPGRTVAPAIRQEGSRLVAENDFYRFVLNTANGLSIESWSTPLAGQTPTMLHPDSGLELTLGPSILSGRDFVLETMNVEGLEAALTFRAKSDPIKVHLHLQVAEAGELSLKLGVENQGSDTLNPLVRFPVLHHLKMGALEETWYLFPQYRNVISNQKGFFRARNDREFPMQFFDIYNPRQGIGLGVLTRYRGFSPMIYALRKEDAGVTAFIEYPKDHYAIAGGQTRAYPETILLSHSGDWRPAFENYQQWLATWHSNQVPSERAWADRMFWMHSLLISPELSETINFTPPLLDPVTKKFAVDAMIEAQKEIFGLVPDAVDFFAWFYSDTLKSYSYGADLATSYANAGGFSVVKQAVADLAAAGIQSGFYMIPDRVSTSVAYAKEHGTDEALRNALGNLMVNDEEIFLCPGAPRWLNVFSELCRQLQADTGVNFIYLDVFSFTSEMNCFDPNHGHAVPFESNQATQNLLSIMRRDLPAKTGLYAEYPVNDVSNEMLDGNLAYYFLPLERYLTPYSDVQEEPGHLLKVAPHLYRFAFPAVKQLSFAFGIETDTWGHLKATFFNGDAIFDATWRLYYPRTREFLRKSLTIKREYLDCFTTREGKPLIQTERAAVVANEFPGTNRTLWTLYNERPATVRGVVLAVDHREGAAYFDVWNQRPLTPEIKEGKAFISLKLDPQGLGCIVQSGGQSLAVTP